MSIQAIDQTSVHRLTSGQVVIDLQTAVKELLENALDAGATAVEVRFKEFGVEAIEVQDNGRGIEQSDWAGIALKHHTSKLTTFSDLTSVETLGFRGEALSSLCGTATLSIQTATASTAPAGTSLTFESSGTCVVGGKVARSKGTTVVVKELFRALPVRRKDLIKNAKREFGKAVELVQSYALIRTGCRIEVKNSVKGKSTTHLQTPAALTLRANFSSIFAPKALASMLDLDLALDVAADKSVLKWTETGSQGSTQVLVKGLISKPTTGSGRPTSSRQFFYVNGRPFSPTKIGKAINEVYKSFNTGSFPCVVADFQLPPDSYDVNVSPDKRTIFLHSEGNLITALKSALEELFQPSRSTFAMSQIGPSKATPSVNVARKDSKASTTSSRHPSSSSSNLQAAQSGHEVDVEVEPPVKRKRGLSVVSTDIDKSDFGEEEEEEDKMDCDDSGRTGGVGPNGGDSAAQLAAKRPKSDDQPVRRTSSSRAPSPHPSPPASLPSSPLKSPFKSPLPPVTMDLDAVDESQPDEPRSRSPSPCPAPPPKLRQLTLDTTGASWAQAAPESAPKRNPAGEAGVKEKNLGGGKNGFSAAVKNLRQFMHPSQQALAMEVDELEEEENEDEEEEEKGDEGGDDAEENGGDAAVGEESKVVNEDVEVATKDSVANNSDDELLVVEDSFKAATPTPRGAPADDKPFVISDDDEPQRESPLVDTTLEQERLDHLASLDVVAGSSTGIDTRSYRDEIVAAQSATDTTVAFDFAAVAAEWSNPLRSSARSRSKASTSSDPLAGASVEEDIDRAEETLSRVVSKEDFASMQVIGQFNLGFIIARRRTQVGASAKGKEKATEDDDEAQDDLFIIDQHASDEKYNFERLQEDTVIQSQRLLHPRPLNMPSNDEITAMEHLDVLKMNGFEVIVDDEADVGQRVKLVAQPVSKDTVFGVEDLEELLDLINARSAGEMVRPSKARKMFASRACRKSVMIGKALNVNQMTTVVRHMGGMDQPWACPHGRPTMRWLAGLGTNVRVEKRNNLAALLLSYSELD